MGSNVLDLIVNIRGQASGDGADKTKKSIDDLNKSGKDGGVIFERLGMVLAGLGLGVIANDILKVNIQMESLRIQLESVTGSARKGTTAFNDMLELARNTPFEIADVTKAFLILKNSGLEPTAEVMDAITNQASKLGGRQEDLTAIATQLGQAYAKASLQMVDIKIIAEHGVPIFDMLGEVTGKTTAQIMDMSEKGLMMRDTIDKLIVKMGELSSGSNQRAMQTLGGQISMLSDAWHKFEDALLQDKSESLIKRIVEDLGYALEGFSEMLNHASGIQLQIDETKKKIFSLQNSMNGAMWHSAEIKALQEKLPLLEKQLELSKAAAIQEDAAATQKAKDKKANENMVNQRLLVADMRKTYGSPQQKMDLELQDVKAKFKAYNMDVPQDIIDGIHEKYAKKLTASLDKNLNNALDETLAKQSKKFNYSFEAVDKAFKANAARVGIDEYLLKAQMKQESGFNPSPTPHSTKYGMIRGASQFLDGTGKQYGITNPNDIFQNITAQANYMRDLKKMFDGDIVKALAAYNTGEGNLKKYGLENVLSAQYAKGQTKGYVKNILADYDKSGGTSAGSELVQKFESDIKLQKNQLEADFSIAKNRIEVSIKNAQEMGSQTTEALKSLKESGQISLETYFEALGETQSEVIIKQTRETQKKLNLALAQFTSEAAQTAPEDLPKLKASFEIEQGSLQSELDRLKAELAKVGINIDAEKDPALLAQRNQTLQTRSSLLSGTKAGADAQQALELDQLGNAFNAGQINAKEFETQLDSIKNKYDSTFQGMVTMGQGAAGALEKGFSDILFDPLHANFRDIALAFLSTLRRMLADALAHAAIKAILNAISGATGGVGGIVGALGSVAGGAGGGTGGYHTGGIAGNPQMHFNVNPLAFAGAARYHSGGIAGLKANEVPAVLQRGEEILTRNDPRHRNNGGMNSNGGGNVTSIVVMDPDFVPDAMAGQMGSKVVINHIRDNASSIKRILDGA